MEAFKHVETFFFFPKKLSFSFKQHFPVYKYFWQLFWRRNRREREAESHYFRGFSGGGVGIGGEITNCQEAEAESEAKWKILRKRNRNPRRNKSKMKSFHALLFRCYWIWKGMCFILSEITSLREATFTNRHESLNKDCFLLSSHYFDCLTNSIFLGWLASGNSVKIEVFVLNIRDIFKALLYQFLVRCEWATFA